MSPSRTTKKAKVRFSPTPQVIISRPRERKVRFNLESHSDSELEFMMRTAGTPATASTSSGSEDDADHSLVGLWHSTALGGSGNRTGKEKEKHPYANTKVKRSSLKRKKVLDVESNIDFLVKRLQRGCQVSVRTESSPESSFSEQNVRDAEDDAM
ncbi:hypothetical protein BDN72DRAFT_845806, partial [Pluteus cervinus]